MAKSVDDSLHRYVKCKVSEKPPFWQIKKHSLRTFIIYILTHVILLAKCKQNAV